ncbi:MAG: zf-HC2 domain-containing protein [Pseudomonadota bacterium]
MMVSCKEVSQLVSRSLDHPLPISERLVVHMHLMVCKLCSRYRRQLHFLQRAARRLPEHLDETAMPPLSDEAKQRIRADLDADKENS